MAVVDPLLQGGLAEDRSVGVWYGSRPGRWECLITSLLERIRAWVVAELKINGDQWQLVENDEVSHTLEGSFMSIQAPSMSTPVFGL